MLSALPVHCTLGHQNTAEVHTGTISQCKPNISQSPPGPCILHAAAQRWYHSIVLGAKPTRTESQSPSPANCQVRSGSSHSNTTPKLQQPATQHSITAIAVAGLNTGCNAQVTGSLAQTASRDGTQDLLPLAECGMAVACCGSPLSTQTPVAKHCATVLGPPRTVLRIRHANNLSRQHTTCVYKPRQSPQNEQASCQLLLIDQYIAKKDEKERESTAQRW